MTDPKLQPAYRYRFRVTRVIDGDTVVGDLDLGCKVWMRDSYVRLLGINAREMHGASAEQGEKDRQHLWQLIFDHALSQDDIAAEFTIETKIVKEASGAADKYGRLLGTLWGSNQGVPVNLNERMLADGFAVPAPAGW